MAIVHSQYRACGEIQVNETTCVQCGLCVEACPADALKMDQGRVRPDESSLLGCFACAHCMMVCPHGSIRVSGRGLSPNDLRPLPEKDSLASAESLEALMRSRRSIRRFTSQDVAPELIERILTLTGTAPMGVPPWDVGCVVVQGREKVKRLSDAILDQYEGMLKFMKPWVLTLLRPFLKRTTVEQFQSFILPLAQTYVDGRKEGRELLFYEAPAVLIFHRSPYAGAEEAAIACTYAMLVATSLGLGSTMIGALAPVLMRNRKLCESLGIPKGNTPALALILGYADRTFRHTVERRLR